MAIHNNAEIRLGIGIQNLSLIKYLGLKVEQKN